MARVEPDLADRLDRRHARERDLHLAEEEGRSRVALGDVLCGGSFLFLFFLASGSRVSERGKEEERREVERSKCKGENLDAPSQWPPASRRPACTGGRSPRASTSRR